MKRYAPLALVVLALAGVPAAFADDSAPAAPSTPAATQPAQKAGHPVARMRLEILRLRLQLAHLRYRIVCHDPSSDACAKFTQNAIDRLTTLDGKVQDKLSELQCSSDSTDKRCTVLGKIDERIQAILSKLNGGTSASSSSGSSESGLDGAAGAVGGTKP